MSGVFTLCLCCVCVGGCEWEGGGGGKLHPPSFFFFGLKPCARQVEVSSCLLTLFVLALVGRTLCEGSGKGSGKEKQKQTRTLFKSFSDKQRMTLR